MMKKTALGLTLAAATAFGAAQAQEVKIGFLGGFTGGIESLAPPIYEGALLAAEHVNAQGGILGGNRLIMPNGDTGCGDAAITQSSADRMVNSDGVLAMVGALCSGATIAASNNIAVPADVPMISPASTSPAITSIKDNDLVFRTVPSDAFQGRALALFLLDQGVDFVAVSYLNNDYGAGLANAFIDTFEANGGTVGASAGHEDNRADYRSDIANLASSGAQTLVVFAYADTSGQTVMRQAYESGLFTEFVGGDGMVGDSLIRAIGADVLEGMILTRPGSRSTDGTDIFNELARDAGVDPTAIFAAPAYDASFLLALAVEANGENSRAGLNDALRRVATAPGEVILPGEWEKARKLLANGQNINYVGATGDHEFDENGDVPGVIEQLVIKNGEIVSRGFLDL